MGRNKKLVHDVCALHTLWYAEKAPLELKWHLVTKYDFKILDLPEFSFVDGGWMQGTLTLHHLTWSQMEQDICIL